MVLEEPWCRTPVKATQLLSHSPHHLSLYLLAFLLSWHPLSLDVLLQLEVPESDDLSPGSFRTDHSRRRHGSCHTGRGSRSMMHRPRIVDSSSLRYASRYPKTPTCQVARRGQA